MLTEPIGTPPPKTPTHVDDWVSSSYPQPTPAEAYAQWVMLHMRLPAVMKSKFRPFMQDHKLFCTFEDKRWRVTGGSRLGDVWLAEDFELDTGYDKRVMLDDCSEWSPSALTKREQHE
jgi:hypothetical protein